jgi:hypothetical protein
MGVWITVLQLVIDIVRLVLEAVNFLKTNIPGEGAPAHRRNENRPTALQKKWLRLLPGAIGWEKQLRRDEAVQVQKAFSRYLTRVLWGAAPFPEIPKVTVRRCFCRRTRRPIDSHVGYRNRLASRWGRVTNKLRYHPWAKDLRIREAILREQRKEETADRLRQRRC